MRAELLLNNSLNLIKFDRHNAIFVVN